MQAGAAKARAEARVTIARLREAVGLRAFHKLGAVKKEAAAPKKKAQAIFKQYREKDGKFYFKLTLEGRDLFVSEPFDSGRDAGQWVGRLKKDAAALDGAPVALCEGVTKDEAKAALATFAEED
jgi:tryptophanyl-tRNA synthetase